MNKLWAEQNFVSCLLHIIHVYTYKQSWYYKQYRQRLHSELLDCLKNNIAYTDNSLLFEIWLAVSLTLRMPWDLF